MKQGLSIFFIILYLVGFSQKKEFDVQKKYSVKQVLEDIDYTEKYLTKFHPDPYRYISKDSLHAFIHSVKSIIDTPLTELQLRYCIKRIVVKIGCGHTDAAASKKYAKAVKKINRPVLPLNVFLTDSSKLVVLNNLSSDTTIKPGDEIISIGNRPVTTVLKTMYSIITTDGYNETCKKQVSRYNSFKYYYSFCHGFTLDYVAKIKHKDNSVTNYKLKAISTLKDTLILPKKDSLIPIYKTKVCNYSIIQNKKPIAVIDINSFRGMHWRRFMKRSFKNIKNNNIEDLVIDLRDNGGGKISLGLNLLSYLIDKKTVLPFDKRINSTAFNPKYKMGIMRTVPVFFAAKLPVRIKNGRLRRYFIGFPKRSKQFKGQVYVLTNGKSFSMSGVVATYLKYKRNAIIIGEETGANIAGSNAAVSGKIVLPNSKVIVFIPLYHLYHDINVKNDGRGLMPDHPTKYTKDNVLNGKDVDIEKVKELVN
ncbi:MAG: S41 family peptidase [Bacteroidota bacterium]